MYTTMTSVRPNSIVQKSYKTGSKKPLYRWLFCLSLIPFLTACGTPEWGGWDSQGTYHRYYSADQNKPGSSNSYQDRSSLSVDTSSSKAGCEGFKPRSGGVSKPEGVILAVAQDKTSQVDVWPVQITATKKLNWGSTKSFRRGGHEPTTDTHLRLDGHELYVTTINQEGSHQVERHPLFVEGDVQKHTLREQPRTMYANRGYVYTTEERGIQALDLRQPNIPSCAWPRYFTDLPATGQHVDLLAQSGNQLLALDNHPDMKYLFIHTLGTNGLHSQTFGAPVALRQDMKYRNMRFQNDLVLLYGSYRKNENVGHLLVTYQVHENSLRPLGEHDAVLHESGQNTEQIPAWQGMEIVNNHVVVSSPRGGLLIFEADLNPKTRKEVVLHGQSKDIIVHGNAVYALVQDHVGTTIHVLRWNQQTLETTDIFRIPVSAHRFVR